MIERDLQDILDAIKVPLTDVQFYSKAFTFVAKNRKIASLKDGDNFKKNIVEEYDELSRRLDRTKIQESCSARTLLRSRRLANLLITDKGELNATFLPKLIAYLTQHLYSCGPERQYDAQRQEHLLKALKLLYDNKNLARLLKNISKPIAHKHAEQMIKDTLQLDASTVLTDAHARKAALSAWFCFLRQNVGSCFATAPAIIVHHEQPELFFTDLNELLSTGRLKRTFGGKEYSVPLSTSWGIGDLKKPFLIYDENTGKMSDIWLSPGLISAFEAVDLIKRKCLLKHKILKSKAIIRGQLEYWKTQATTHPVNGIVCAEDVLQKAVLDRYNLTLQDLQDYENRPKTMIQSSLLMQVPKAASGSGGKGEACANFKRDFETAKNAFKSVVDNALLKAWEFTIASFAETKADFARWNLYSSLGLKHDEVGGIGACLYQILKKKLEECNEKIKELQFEYEQMFNQVKYLETRIKRASTENEVQWLRIEYQTKTNEFYNLQEIRDEQNSKAHRYTTLFDLLIEFYDEKFPEYFQEIYDAEMHDVATGPYDDSPAGFRLIYKHGRTNTSQWTPIYNPNEFIDALSNFFIATEHEIRADDRFKGLESDLSEIVTAVVNHIKTKEFLETAFYRMAIAHHSKVIKNPLENLDKIEKKPWVYTSGGTMGSLVSCYYRREQMPTEVSRWVENEIELLVFFLDTLKQMPYKITQEYIIDSDKSILMHSPTHAFLLKPGLSPFKEGWLSEVFTYTWVRDNIVESMQKFVDNIYLDEDKMNYLLELIFLEVPHQFQHLFQNAFERTPASMKAKDFRRYVLETISRDRALRHFLNIFSPEDLDRLLYLHLPLFPSYQLKERLDQLYKGILLLNQQTLERIDNLFNLFWSTYPCKRIVSSKDLQDIAKGILCLALEATSLPIDIHYMIAKNAQKLGYAMHTPVIFADSNWVRDQFGFVVNPGTGQFELWRLDYLGINGTTMMSWKQWVNGSRQDVKWGIYSRPHEYKS